MCRFSAEAWWLSQFYMEYGYPGLFRAGNHWGVRGAVVGRGQWVYKDHNNMVRGMVGKERLLEWSVEEGWGPLCEVCIPVDIIFDYLCGVFC
jgi:hypothetical protein